MTQEERLDFLIDYLQAEYTQTAKPESFTQKRALLRGLVNIRPPRPVSQEFIRIQDEFLQEEARQKGIVAVADIQPCRPESPLALWQGDITRLALDAIVNAANAKLLGCFVPGHACIDNAIHTFAGVQLRQACSELMQAQGHDEATGLAKITAAYNLPSRYVLHTVGPIVRGTLTQKRRAELASCYRSCLALAAEHSLKSIAFCCISTGAFGFPQQEAAETAVKTVAECLKTGSSIQRVVFNVFTDDDYVIYRDLLKV
ncbi:MAG: protein-ADP-ribose hydrolase [Spirochaetaceae bacterium]|jgi:O-acetyl-ADP-ribose deacetylase (regulator of RNase III)|nr:protein-ADP-ribose hydrolase [Spirochaetaceae bacterium]